MFLYFFCKCQIKVSMEGREKIVETSKKASRRARKRRARALRRKAKAQSKLWMSDANIRKEIFETFRISGERLRFVDGVLRHEKFELGQENNAVKCPNCDNNRQQPMEEVIDLYDSENSRDGCNSGDARDSPPNRASDQPPLDSDLDGLSTSTTYDIETIDLTGEESKPQQDCMGSVSDILTVIDAGEEVLEEPADIKTDNGEVQFLGIFPGQNNFKHKQGKEFAVPNQQRPLCEIVEEILNSGFPIKKTGNGKKSPLVPFRRDPLQLETNADGVDENVYIDAPIGQPSSGLRPIIIDGSNVAFVRSNCNFSCRRLEICINYFKEKGHKVTAFVPEFRSNTHRSDDPQLLRKLEQQGDVVFTPSKRVDGLNIVPYDDRYIVQTAFLKGGIIVTRDKYNDLLKENPAWAETIKYRTLAFTWVDDLLIFPKDPLGEFGPRLDEFLRFN